jgi:GxxExxY protein
MTGFMHSKYKRADAWTKDVIGSAIEVHREKGAGLIESIYEKCLMRELGLRRIPAVNQVVVPIEYKGYIFDEPLKLDVYVDNCLIVELKAVEQVLPIHEAQLLSYMKLMNAPIGLLMNFHEVILHKGIRRFLLKGAADE